MDSMKGSYLGPEFTNAEIERFLREESIPYSRLDDASLAEHVAEDLARGRVVGWFQGRMEFGPRALGGRSIIGDARNTKMQSTMNLKIKYRESFRPFAPSVLRERVADYFKMDCDSPYMLLVAPVCDERRIAMTDEQKNYWGIELLNVPRSEIPAVTHVDYSARIQTVHRETNPRYYDLIRAFERKPGCGVIVNTSFNVRGEPIVCSPQDAYRCFMRTEMDVLVLGNFVLQRADQKALVGDADWRKEFALD
jgi:carbamoyltransferase